MHIFELENEWDHQRGIGSSWATMRAYCSSSSLFDIARGSESALSTYTQWGFMVGELVTTQYIVQKAENDTRC